MIKVSNLASQLCNGWSNLLETATAYLLDILFFNHEVTSDVFKAVLKRYWKKGRIAFFLGHPV